MGTQAYGIWVMLQSAAAFSGLLDLGFRSAVIRFVSRYEAAGDEDGVRENATAGLLYFSMGGAVILTIGVVAAILVRKGIFQQVSPSLSAVVVVLSAVAALNLPTSFFRGLLYARERIDLSNTVNMAGTVVKVALILLLVSGASSLLTLAWIELTYQLLLIGLMVFSTLFVYGRMPFRFSSVRWRTWLEMWRYGGFTLINQLSVRAKESAPPLLIGSLLSAGQVPIFSIAASMANYLAEIVTKIGGVLTPSISRLEGRGELSTAAELVLGANRLSVVLAGVLGVAVIGMGRPFLHIWLGPAFDESYWLLIVLVVGSVAGSAQMPTVAYFYGTGTHDRLVWLSLSEALLVVALGAAGALAFGIQGVAVGVLVAGVVPRMIIRPLIFCRLAHVSVRRFLGDYYTGLALFAVAALLAESLSKWALHVHSYFGVLLLGIIWGGGYALLLWVVFLRPEERAALLQLVISGRRYLPRRMREAGRAR
ncbi:lipopolysaccharide biosynthesis protein [Nitrococcus mobilis]|uniref:Polysaccharide biosynthesis family protein n=1 Tax=Nitrococcus mobilis Nb-231 TaxID=314278 RepID=A4BT76_9GAMM|nr:lipopolysaccharide biosynthesis protein [Nitrococcus mobilis]EAR21144.1 polysaccharide biosynthesis family protein [Nitrococcus mobilis Nb-231]